MFKFLRDKISSWAKKISENKAKEVPIEEEEIEIREKKKPGKKAVEKEKPLKKTKPEKHKKQKKGERIGCGEPCQTPRIL